MFKNLKSLFVVDDDEFKKNAGNKEEKKNTQPKTNAPKTNRPPRPIDNTQPVDSHTEQAGKVEKKFMNILFKAMEKANLPGLDYLEFKTSLKSLSSMPMDEATQYKSAFAMAQAMGATPDHLIKTAQHYLEVLLKEEQKFQHALGQQNEQRVGNQIKEIKAMEMSVKAKAEQIAKLTKEIEQTQNKITASKQSIQEVTSKIRSTKSNFVASYNTIKGQIEKDVTNMKQYLK